MATFTGKQIANSYKQLLQVGNNNIGITGELQSVQDGEGNNSALQLSNAFVNINGALQLNGVRLTSDASALNAIADLTGATGIVAVSAGNVNGRTLTAGTGVSITNADGTEGNPTIALNPSGATSGSYTAATNFEVNAVGQVVSIGAATSINVSGVTGTTFTGGTFAGTTGDFSSNVSVGGNLKIDGAFTPAALSVTGTINAAKVSASIATFNNIVSAAFFVGDGSGLTNVPSAEGGTMKRIDAGTGIKMTVGGAVSSSIPVSGVVAGSADQNFGTVSVSTALAVTGDLLISGVTAATVNEVAAVSALTKTNLDAITSINTVVANVSALTSVNTAAITSINTIIGDGGNFATSAELATVSAALATSIENSNTNIAAVSVLTSVNTAAVTSINTVVAAVSALTKTNLDSITSINTVVAGVSALTSVNTAAVTSINTVVAAVSALTSVNTAAVTSINTVVAAVSALTKTNLDAVTSINTVVAGVSALTSVNAAAVTSINTVVTDLSATMATSIGTRLPLAGGTLTGIVSGTSFFVSAIAVGANSLLGKDIHIEKAAVADIQALSDGTNISVDLNAGQNFTVTLAGNRTLDNPTNCVAGQVGSIFVVQDSTGSRTLAYGTSWDFPGGTAPTLSTDAAAIDRIDYIVHTSTDVHAVLTKAYS